MTNVNTNVVLRVLRKMAEPITAMESYKAGVINQKGEVIVPKGKRTPVQERAFNPIERMVLGLKKESSPMAYVSAFKMMREYIESEYNTETSQMLTERLCVNQMVPTSMGQYDLSTYDGFMDAVDEVMAEMVSGAGIGGAFDGAQSNADANATGMAAPTGSSKKKSKVKNILRRL